MDATGTLRMLIGQLPGTLPVLIALAVGLALVLQARELPHPARRLGLLGFGLLLAANLLGLLAWPALRAAVLAAALPAGQTAWIFAALNLPLALLNAAGLVLLALALVRRRS